jgi:hypothetical protein
MAQLARHPDATAPHRPPHRRLSWYGRPFVSLVRAWRSQTELWERWQAAPYKNAGPLRWQRREGRLVLEGAQLPHGGRMCR